MKRLMCFDCVLYTLSFIFIFEEGLKITSIICPGDEIFSVPLKVLVIGVRIKLT